MKPHLTVQTKRTSLSSMALMAVFLLSLPGSAWAQAALSGQVKFSDGSAAAGATVQAYSPSSDTSASATVDASGAYVLYLTPGTYNIGIQFSSPDVYCSQVLLSSYTVSSSAQLNLDVPDLILNGRIVNSAGQPVASAQLFGFGSSQNGSCSLYPYSGTDGRFQVRILPGTYSSLRLNPPSGSSYALTPLPSQTFSASVTRDFILTDPVTLRGQVKFSDGSAAAGAIVQADSPSGDTPSSATVDASGAYVLYLTPGTYNIGVQFSSPDVYCSQVLLSSYTVSSSAQLNLDVPDLILNGRIVNSAGQPVASAQLSGFGSSQNGSCNLYPYSGTDGRFQVRILPGTYSSLRLNPPSGSSYALTALPSQTFSASVTRDFVLTDPVTLRGQVKFSDGSAAAGATVQASSPSSDTSSSATVDASGAYVLHLTPGTYNIGVQFSSSDVYCSQVLLSSYTVSSSAQLNLGVPDLILNGRIVNSAGQPVASTQLSGFGTSQNGSCNLYPYSGTDGRFQVRILPGTYSNLQLYPATGSGYVQTLLPSQTFSASVSKEYVIVDADECGFNNGGCSMNATCTNVPGSRTCTCNPGYTGDGLTCEVPPARLIVNEILANEPGSATSGEFVELVNVGGSALDISGWTVSDATDVRHTFAAGTVLAPGKAVVVFGGASSIPSGLSNAVAASTGTLSLANASDSVTVKDTAGVSVDSFSYTSSLASADGVSMNRNPDATVGAGFALHNTVSTLTASAGKRANGTAF